MSTAVFTIGHSTRPFDKFLEMLQIFHIGMIADVRTIPKSWHNPQFNLEDLRDGLEAHGIGYIHIVGLGGLRHTTIDSINMGWKNPSFRGYADYMQTTAFDESLKELMTIAREDATAIMCAEAVPWRCHRSLIGDALLVHGFSVEDIMSDKKSTPHKLTPWARIDGNSISYPGPEPPPNRL
ncbi:MAG TPA: DUF488 domain-containing protein [Dehalococcoidales bacterium]